MPNQQTTLWISNFKGLDDSTIPGATKQVGLTKEQGNPYTPDELNVKTRFGLVSGRGGLYNYQAISAASSTSPIIGLAQFSRAKGASNSLVRMTPTKLEWLTGGAWTDITGTALAGSSTTRPQFEVIQDTMIFTNEGANLPRKWTGSGNSATLGGSPPYGKSIVQTLQYAMLGNISNDGTFTDVFDGWRTIQYADSFDTNWTLCSGNLIDLNQTTGDLLRMLVLGRSLMCLKNDGVVRLGWVGGGVRFTQELITPKDGSGGSPMVGLAGPLAACVTDRGIAMLGTNGILYNLTEQGMTAISPEALSQTLTRTIQNLSRFKYARMMVLPSQDVAILLYDRTGLTGQFLDSYIAWNYRTEEFDKGRLGKQVIAAVAFRSDFQSSEVGLVSTSTLVDEFDSTNLASDDGVAVNRYRTTGWHQTTDGDWWFYGARIIMRKAPGARIKVSVATDLSPKFGREQYFSLRSTDPTSDVVECSYRVPSPIPLTWVNIKVTMLYDKAGATTDLMRVGLVGSPLHAMPETPQRMPVGEARAG